MIELSQENPVVIETNRALFELVEEVFSVLRSTNRFFIKGDSYVCVDEKDHSLLSLNRSQFCVELSRLIKWKYTTDKKSIECELPLRKEKILYEVGITSELPQIHAIAKHPIIDEKGDLEFFNGYEEKRKIFYSFDKESFLSCGWKTLSKESVQSAIKRIEDIFSDFPVKTDIDRSILISSLLTAVMRPVLPTAPMIVVNANRAGVGKTLLCEALAIVASGEKPITKSYPSDENEAARMLIATLRESPPAILFDNVVDQLSDFPAVCTVLTQTTFSDRIIGSSQNCKVLTNSLFLASGNRVISAGDMKRRVLILTLDSENCAGRKFKFNDFLEYVLDHREEIVMNLQKICAFYLREGKQQRIASIPTYTRWSRLCREPVVYLGFPDPARHIVEFLQETDGYSQMRYELVNSISEIFRQKPFGSADLAAAATTNSKLFQLLPPHIVDSNKKINVASLGNYLSSLYKSPPREFQIYRQRSKPSARYCIVKKTEP